ncbi:MAG: peptide chain release factor N(5)-glutamine methyltransferase [Parachlamydiales bacterium]|nr:peptide chain release factor N(5)-glutamine methyltransferase [Parachlamydiales bacterium]
MKTVSDILKLCQDYLTTKGVPNPRRQSEDLISLALGIKRLEVYTQFDRPLVEKELDVLRTYLKRRGQREPLAYIHGQVEFYETLIDVNPHVLIPRPETEQLVGIVVKALESESLSDKKFVDICTGSGCIAISLKNKFNNLSVSASDLSLHALDQAKKNSINNNVDINFFQGDLTKPLINEKFDYVVVNPPYVKKSDIEGLDPEVRLFEPHQALIGGESGLELYQRLADELPLILNAKGRVWMEIGCDQAQDVLQFFSSTIWTIKTIFQDWSGRDRFFFLEKE